MLNLECHCVFIAMVLRSRITAFQQFRKFDKVDNSTPQQMAVAEVVAAKSSNVSTKNNSNKGIMQEEFCSEVCQTINVSVNSELME